MVLSAPSQLLVALAGIAVVIPLSIVSAADTWVTECPGDAFCFSRPTVLIAQPGQMIDSLAARYRGGGLMLTFDMGRRPMSVAHLNAPAVEPMTIDGRPAQLYSVAREFMLVVPRVHDVAGSAVNFAMVLRFDGEPARETARAIFQSIRFKPPR